MKYLTIPLIFILFVNFISPSFAYEIDSKCELSYYLLDRQTKQKDFQSFDLGPDYKEEERALLLTNIDDDDIVLINKLIDLRIETAMEYNDIDPKFENLVSSVLKNTFKFEASEFKNYDYPLEIKQKISGRAIQEIPNYDVTALFLLDVTDYTFDLECGKKLYNDYSGIIHNLIVHQLGDVSFADKHLEQVKTALDKAELKKESWIDVLIGFFSQLFGSK